MKQAITTTEAAGLLGIKERLVTRYIVAGRLSAMRFGRVWLVDPKSVENFERLKRGRKANPKAKTAAKRKTGRPRKTEAVAVEAPAVQAAEMVQA